MKKLLLIVLIMVALTLCFVGCKKSTKPKDSTDTSTEISQSTGDSEVDSASDSHTDSTQPQVDTFTVTFTVNEQGYGSVSEESLENVESGTVITVDENTVTIGDFTVTATAATETAQYAYAFKGWSGTAETVTGDMTITANFEATTKEYAITWKNGDEVVYTAMVAYGETPEYKGETPAKEADAQYTYAFKGWDNEMTAVTGEATYTAIFEATTREYTVTFMNGEALLDTEKVDYNGTVTYNGEMPENGDLVFIGWRLENGETNFDFATAITSDTLLYAYFVKPEFSYGKPAFDQYAVGATFDPGKASFVNTDATIAVKDPDGNTVEKGENGYTLTKVGAYTVTLSATVNGKDYAEERTVKCVTNAALLSGNDENSYAYPAQIAGYGYTTMAGLHVAAGDEATYNTYVDWSGSGYVILTPNFVTLTQEDYYKAFPVIITLYNAENADEYITITITANSWMAGDVQWDQVYFKYSYCGGEAVSTDKSMHIGSGAADAYSLNIFVSHTDGGTTFNTGATQTLAGANFTKAVMTIRANADFDITTPYVNDGRDWKVDAGKLVFAADSQQVYFRVNGTITEHEYVVTGGTANYYLATPAEEGKYFVGWVKDGTTEIFDLSTPITGYTVLDAKLETIEYVFSYGKPAFDQYAVGSAFDPGEAKLSVMGKTYPATLTVTDPDANAVEKGENGYTLTKVGAYTVTLSATIGEEIHTETRTLDCVTNVAYVSGNNANTYAYPGVNNYCAVKVAAGDTATFNKYISWDGISWANNYFLLQLSWQDMARAEYIDSTPLIITLYNAENSAEYVTVVINFTAENDAPFSKFYADFYYCGTKVGGTYSTRYAGNDAGGTQDVVIQLGMAEGGMQIGVRDLDYFFVSGCSFTKAVMTIQSQQAINFTTGYVGDARPWTVSDDRLYA